MREITIIATFRIGTTMDDAKKAKEHCKQLLLARLKENDTAGDPGGRQLFIVKIERVKSQRL